MPEVMEHKPSGVCEQRTSPFAATQLNPHAVFPERVKHSAAEASPATVAAVVNPTPMSKRFQVFGMRPPL
jgi:hypothetical protein